MRIAVFSKYSAECFVEMDCSKEEEMAASPIRNLLQESSPGSGISLEWQQAEMNGWHMDFRCGEKSSSSLIPSSRSVTLALMQLKFPVGNCRYLIGSSFICFYICFPVLDGSYVRARTLTTFSIFF